MKQLTFFIGIFLLVALSCKKDNNFNTLSGNWQLVSYEDVQTGTIDYEPQNINRSIIIEFSDNGKKGTLSGHTVTNIVSGEYELKEKNKIEVLSFGGTKVGEPAWGSKFWDAMYNASSYERTSEKMSILFNFDTEKMTFNKE